MLIIPILFVCEVVWIESVAIVWSENGELRAGLHLLAQGPRINVFQHAANSANKGLYCGPRRCFAPAEFGFFSINANYRWERGLAKASSLLLTVIAMQASTVAGSRAQYRLGCNHLQLHVDVPYVFSRRRGICCVLSAVFPDYSLGEFVERHTAPLST